MNNIHINGDATIMIGDVPPPSPPRRKLRKHGGKRPRRGPRLWSIIRRLATALLLGALLAGAKYAADQLVTRWLETRTERAEPEKVSRSSDMEAEHRRY